MNLPYLEIGDCIFRIGKFSNHSKKNNSYLVIKQEFASIIDPGPFSHFPDTFSIVKSLIYDKPLQYCICYNSDPDICSSIPLWEKEYPYMTVLSASFCAELIGCYNTNLKCLSVNEKCAEYIQLPGKYMIELFSLPEIGLLTFDHVSKILFSGKLFCSKNESAYEDRQQYIEEVTSNNKKILKNSAALSIETIQKKLTSLDVTMIAPTYGPLINDSLTVTDSIKKSIYQNNSTTHQSLNVSNKSLQTDKTLRHRNLNVDDLLPPDVKKRIPSKNLSIHKPVEPEMNVDTDEKKNSEILLNRKCTEQTSGEQKNSAELIKGMDNQNENETHHTDYFNMDKNTCSTDENMRQMKGEQKDPVICNIVVPPIETPPDEKDQQEKQEADEIGNDDINRIRDENLALKKQIKSIENKLLKCHVTDLYNETYFFEYMKEEILNSLTYQLNGALLILELDKATTINVEFGLQGLEETLLTMSYLLNETKGDGHFLFKLEGACFGFYIPFCEKEEAFKLAEKFRNTIEKSGNFYCPVTVSTGISVVSEFYDDDSSIDILSRIFTKAKTRLKFAKESGNIVIGSDHIKTNIKNKILIIEYDQFHYNFLSKLLAQEGILTIHCSDGFSGLETLEKMLPDVVIAEINLPKVNGYLIREKMLNSSILKKIPFILISHIKNPESIKRAAALKIEYYLKKPYVTEELTGLIKNLLDKVSNY